MHSYHLEDLGKSSNSPINSPQNRLRSVEEKKTPEEMYRRGEGHSWQQNGWDTTSQDYHEHLSRVARLPSIHPNVPQYPNVHGAFNKKAAREEERELLPSHHQHSHNRRSPQFQEKVEVIEFKEERFERNRGEEREVIEEVVDVKADGFIQQKHRGFELCKWNTFKAP